MDFGRVSDPAKLAKIKWDLPSLCGPEELHQLTRLQRAGAKYLDQIPKIYVGTPVWAEAKWVGKLYPDGTSPDSFLKEFVPQLSMVEVNSTFYAIPTQDTFSKWTSCAYPGFRFCPKFPQSISRVLATALELKDLDVFTERVRVLGENRGVCFLQLPPDVGMESLGRLQTLFARIPRDLKSVVEFRNASFFVNRRLRPEVVNMLATHHLGTVITDTALHRELVHASLSSSRVMIRFASNDMHPSDELRMDQWVERLKVWYQNGMKEIFLSVHAEDPLAEISATRLFIQKINSSFQELPDFEAIPEPIFYHEQQATLF